MEAATEVIVARSRDHQTLSPMVAVSVAAHAALVAAVLFAPAPSFEDDTPKTVMTISLGGSPGPRAGGMTAMGGQAVQTTKPLESTPVRAPVAPAPTTPEMTLPRPDAKPQPRRPQPRAEVAPKEATSRTPTVGSEVREGSTRTDTGARGRGFGLSGGGGKSGSGAYVDVGNFCCPEYLEQVVQIIQRNWDSKQNMTGVTLMKFTIDRNGTLRDVRVERASGFFALDQAAQRALLLTRTVPALPGAFTNPTLTVGMYFEYQR